MNNVIEFLTWLDTSNAAYVLMLFLFLVLAAMQNATQVENTRLRKILRKAVLETKR